jgi:hypothetical protein
MSGVPGDQHLLSRANDRNGSHDSQVRHRIVRRLTQKEGGKSDDCVTVADKDVRCAPDCLMAPRTEGTLKFPKEGAMNP